MSCHTGFLLWLYGRLLALYPRGFRAEFETDMRADFLDALDAARRRSAGAELRVGILELCDVLRAAFWERLNERRRMSGSFQPVSARAVGLTLFPFAIMLFVFLSNALKLSLPEWVGVLMLGALLALFFIGGARGLPDWCLPSLGLLAAAANLFWFSSYANRLYAFVPHDSSQAVRIIAGSTIFWLGLLLIVPLFLGLALVKPLRPFWERIRADWTVLSFALYGVMLLALLLVFEEYQGEEPFQIAALGALAFGAIVYLQSAAHKVRVLALAGGITTAFAIVAIAQWILLPYQPWPMLSRELASAWWRWNEIAHVVVVWVWMLLFIIALPALLVRILRQFAPAPLKAV